MKEGRHVSQSQGSYKAIACPHLDQGVQYRRCIAGEGHAWEQLAHGAEGGLADLQWGRGLAWDHQPGGGGYREGLTTFECTML